MRLFRCKDELMEAVVSSLKDDYQLDRLYRDTNLVGWSKEINTGEDIFYSSLISLCKEDCIDYYNIDKNTTPEDLVEYMWDNNLINKYPEFTGVGLDSEQLLAYLYLASRDCFYAEGFIDEFLKEQGIKVNSL